MLKNLVREAKKLHSSSGLFVDRPNGYDIDLPDNILIFARGGLSPIAGQGAIHHRYLLNLNLGAPCGLLLDGRRFLLETGAMFLIYPYENHLFLHTDEKIFRLMITFEVKRSDILPERHSSAILNPDSVHLAAELLRAYRNGAEKWDLTLLLTLLLSRFRQDTQKDTASVPFPENSSFAPRIVKYIMNHLDKDLGLEKMAKQFHISKSHLRRRFQAETGVSLGEYIRRSRITKAMYHLSRNEENIGEIAELCGYSSIQAFSRAFREKAGITPQAYRSGQLRLRRTQYCRQ